MITKDGIFEPVYELMKVTENVVSFSVFKCLAFSTLNDSSVSQLNSDCMEAAVNEALDEAVRAGVRR